MSSKSEKIKPVRDSEGYFKESDLEKLDLKSIIKLMISEQSFQETMNVVRSTK